jgi:hypothetical protein
LKSRLSSSPLSLSVISSCLSKSSRAWLLAFPTPSSSLTDREFRLASRLRLGLPPSDTLPRVCRCSARLDQDPGHFLSCKLLYPVARVRHDRIVRHLSTLTQRAGGVALVEPRYLEDKRPDIHAFFPDDRIMLDVLVLHPSSPSYLHNSIGSALRYRENEKLSAYTPLATELGCRFLPFALESYGTLGSFAINFMHDLASYAKESFSTTYSSSAALSSLSILLQKGNAEMLSQGCLLARAALRGC